MLTLQKTRDILADVAQLDNSRPFTVGFAAETHDLEKYALDKLARKNLDMIAANWVGQIPPSPPFSKGGENSKLPTSPPLEKGDLGGFDSDQNALQVFWKNGSKTLAMTDKNHLAEQLIRLIAERMEHKNA
jgi:phosphopantothenoylcysteine decarboxylase/phosphopantothenate--cysteine ligase